MPSTTRSDALAEARVAFRNYVERLRRRDTIPTEILAEIEQEWLGRLTRLSRYVPTSPVADEVVAALRFLEREIKREDMDPDALVRWVDAFPDAVADLFPPSAVTYEIAWEGQSAARAKAPRGRAALALVA